VVFCDITVMGNVSERRKLRTPAEFRIKAASLRTIAAEVEPGPLRNNILAMAKGWEAKAEGAEATAEGRRPGG
jgi:hypothetical protein